MGVERNWLGPAEWAVVTKYLGPPGFFLRLEDSGEKAFMDMVSVDDHSPMTRCAATRSTGPPWASACGCAVFPMSRAGTRSV